MGGNQQDSGFKQVQDQLTVGSFILPSVTTTLCATGRQVGLSRKGRAYDPP